MEKLLLFVSATVLLFAAVSAQVEVKCEEGEKLSKIARENGHDGFGGPLMAECDPLLGDKSRVQGAQCKQGMPFVCTEKMDEGCIEEHSYLAGVSISVIDEATGAFLFVPTCCTASNVIIDAENCTQVRLNSYKAPFESDLPFHQVFTKFQCFNHIDRQNTVHDTIMLTEVCDASFGDKSELSVKSTTGSPNGGDNTNGETDPNTCEKCHCECGPYTCPVGERLAASVVHRRVRRQTCTCKCKCDFVCAQETPKLNSRRQRRRR